MVIHVFHPVGLVLSEVDVSYTEQIDLPDTPASQATNATIRPDRDENKFYVEQIKAMKEFELTTLYVDFSHLLEREEVLARAIQDQYYRYAHLLHSFQPCD